MLIVLIGFVLIGLILIEILSEMVDWFFV